MLPRLRQAIDRFLFESCDPASCVLLRICYSLLMIIYAGVLLGDASTWFSTEGVLTPSSATSDLRVKPWSIFFVVEPSPWLVQGSVILLLLCSCSMLVGFFSRMQALLIFVLLTSLHHANPLVLDGEDTVFRLFAFFLALMPLDYSWSLSAHLRRTIQRRFGRTGGDLSVTENGSDLHKQTAWALRLVQLQMALIYLSAAWSKTAGHTWQSGSALYYVFQLGDLYGRGPVPAVLTETEWLIRGATWGVVLLEAALPFLLFFRPTRTLGLALGVLLHLSIEYAMHLFLFQWIMIVGLLSFARPIRLFQPRASTSKPANGTSQGSSQPATAPNASQAPAI